MMEPSAREYGRYMTEIHEELNRGQKVILTHNNLGWLGYYARYKDKRGKIYHNFVLGGEEKYEVHFDGKHKTVATLDEARKFIEGCI